MPLGGLKILSSPGSVKAFFGVSADASRTPPRIIANCVASIRTPLLTTRRRHDLERSLLQPLVPDHEPVSLPPQPRLDPVCGEL